MEEDVRIALGRAMKTEFSCTLRAEQGQPVRLGVTNVGQWPARDVAVKVEIPGLDPLEAVGLGDLSTTRGTWSLSVGGLGPITPAVEEHLVPLEGSASGARVLRARITVSYTDRDGCLRHEAIHRADLHVGPPWNSIISSTMVAQIEEHRDAVLADSPSI